MKRRNLLQKACALGAAGSLLIAGATALLLPGAASAQAPVTLKFSHTDTPIGARQKTAELFAKKVEESTRSSIAASLPTTPSRSNSCNSAVSISPSPVHRPMRPI